MSGDKMESLISIIVPIYNSEAHLSECIESILKQSYEDIELILVNDGSKDSSFEICNYYQEIDDRVMVINKKNGGVSSARNSGLRAASGDYIGFVDSDDFIHEDMYKILINKIQKNESDIAALTNYTINDFSKKRTIDKQTVSGPKALKKLFLLRFPTSVWAYLYKSSLLENEFLNANIHFFEDFEFNTRVLSKTEEISICGKKLYNYRSHKDSTNNQEINDKRVSCLKIYKLVKSNLRYRKNIFLKYGNFFRSYFLITVINSIFKSKHVKDKYYRLAQIEAKEIVKNNLFNKIIPLYYKAIIFCFAYFPRLFSKLSKLIKINR